MRLGHLWCGRMRLGSRIVPRERRIDDHPAPDPYRRRTRTVALTSASAAVELAGEPESGTPSGSTGSTRCRPAARSLKQRHSTPTEGRGLALSGNIEIIMRFEHAFRAADQATIDELCDPGLVDHHAPDKEPTLAGFKQKVAGFKAIFPDLKEDLQDIIASGTVATRWVLTGSQQRELRPLLHRVDINEGQHVRAGQQRRTAGQLRQVAGGPSAAEARSPSERPQGRPQRGRRPNTPGSPLRRRSSSTPTTAPPQLSRSRHLRPEKVPRPDVRFISRPYGRPDKCVLDTAGAAG